MLQNIEVDVKWNIKVESRIKISDSSYISHLCRCNVREVTEAKVCVERVYSVKLNDPTDRRTREGDSLCRATFYFDDNPTVSRDCHANDLKKVLASSSRQPATNQPSLPNKDPPAAAGQ